MTQKTSSIELQILLDAIKLSYRIVSGEQQVASSKESTHYTDHSAPYQKETGNPPRYESSTTSSKESTQYTVRSLQDLHGDNHTLRDDSRTSQAASPNFDVDRLLRLAAIHKLRPVLLAYDKEHGILPPEVRQQLEAIHQRQVMRNLKLTQVYLEVYHLLTEHGIEVLPMKGNLLIHTVYGNQQLRETGDVDILLRRSDVKRAVEILKQLDFRLRPDMNPQAHRYQNELVNMLVDSPHQSELPLSRGSDHVDVHWSAAQPYFGLHFQTDQVIDRAQIGDFFNAKVLLPVPEDALMLTVIHHGGKEHWKSLRHLLDFALMIKIHPPGPNFRESARKVGVLKAFDTGCQLLNQFGLLNDNFSTARLQDATYQKLITASWEQTTTKTARDQWFVKFPLRMRGKNPRQGLLKSFTTVVQAQIDHQKIQRYPDSFGIKAFTQKAFKLAYKLISGKN